MKRLMMITLCLCLAATPALAEMETVPQYFDKGETAPDALAEEQAAQEYFGETMAEYVNHELGFSLQYPAVFEDLSEDASGVSASLPDGSAAFYARRRENQGAKSLTETIDALQAMYPTSSAAYYEISGSGRVTHQRTDGFTQVDIVVVTPDWVFEAQLIYSAALAGDFDLYAEYMTNSLMADELGIG